MTSRLAFSVLALALLAGCGYDATPPDPEADRPTDPVASSTPADAAAPAQSTQPLLVREGGEQGHLADASGAALYYLEGNRDGSSCDEACEQVWPPVTSDEAHPPAAAGVDRSAVATLQGADGRNHVTYQGQPLYRYAGDRGARTTTGDDVQDQWGHWKLVSLDGGPASPSAGMVSGDGQAQSGDATSPTDQGD